MKDFKLYTKFNFAKCVEHFDDDDTASITCFECLRNTFEDSIVNEFGSLYTVSINFNF